MAQALSDCMVGTSPPTPGDVLLVFTIGYSSWLHLAGAGASLAMTGVFSPDHDATQRVADMLPSLREGLMASLRWWLGQQCCTFKISRPGQDVIMEVWVGCQEDMQLIQCLYVSASSPKP